jgi:hypothetical protein
MFSLNRRTAIKAAIAGLVLGAAASTAAAAPPAPPVSISLCNREAHAWPARKGFTHTGGGNIDVQQPTPDVVVITLTGVAVAGAHPVQNSIAQMAYEVCQEIEISFDDPKVKKAKLALEGRVIGLLRSHKGGGLAAISQATASVGAAGSEQLSIAAPTHTVNNGVSLSINDLIACQTIPVPAAGPYSVRGHLCISATHPRSVCPMKASSSEFAPDPALDPLWISYWEPFHGAAKKDFGFQITVRVSDDSPTGPAAPPAKPVAANTARAKTK